MTSSTTTKIDTGNTVYGDSILLYDNGVTEYYGVTSSTYHTDLAMADGISFGSMRDGAEDSLLLDIAFEGGDLLDASSYESPFGNSETVAFVPGRAGGEAVRIDGDSGFEFDRQDIAQVYDLDAFSLDIGLRADTPGDVLTIHTALDIRLDKTGQVSVRLVNADDEAFTLRSSESVVDGQWHDLTLSFDGPGGAMTLYVDGVESATTEASGQTQPMEYWGMMVGGVGWRNGFTGEIDTLEFRQQADAPTLTPEGPAIEVSNSTDLLAALASAAPGEVIELMPGNYGELGLYAHRAPWTSSIPDVTITSADPDDMAVITGLDLRGVSGLTFDGIFFDYTAESGAPIWHVPFTVGYGSSDITFRNSVFDGDLASGLDAVSDGYGTGVGLNIRNSNDITVENNEIYGFYKGAGITQVSDLKFIGNDIHSTRSDSMAIVEVHNILIEDNYFHDFVLAPESGDHVDMIQFWTTATDRPSTDVTIRGNRLMSEEGGLTQSLFMRNEEVDLGRAGKEMFYRNVLIEDNLIWNAHLHGITVGETDGLTIRNNTVLWNVPPADIGGPGYVPGINVSSDAVNVAIESNITAYLPDAQPGWVVADNLLVQRTSPNLPDSYQSLFINALNDGLAGVEDLQALPGGIIEQNGYGAAMTRYDATPDTLTALIRQEEAPGDDSLMMFDGSLTASPDGRISAGEAQFFWDFGDGNTASGITASHSYGTPGSYIATLRVVTEDGNEDITRSRVDIPDPLLLDIDFRGGDLLDASSYESPFGNSETAAFVPGRDGGEAVRIDGNSGFEFDRQDIAQVYDLDRFSLDIGLRAEAPGDVLTIHTALDIRLDKTGRVSVSLVNADDETFTLRSSERVVDGQWHDLTLSFDGPGGTLKLSVDGVESAATEASGQTQPMEYWGLMVGGVGWRKGFTGEIDTLEFRSDTPLPGDGPDIVSPVPYPVPRPDPSIDDDVTPWENGAIDPSDGDDNSRTDSASGGTTDPAHDASSLESFWLANGMTDAGDDFFLLT